MALYDVAPIERTDCGCIACPEKSIMELRWQDGGRTSEVYPCSERCAGRIVEAIRQHGGDHEKVCDAVTYRAARRYEGPDIIVSTLTHPAVALTEALNAGRRFNICKI